MPFLSPTELEQLAADRPLVTPELFTPNDFYGSAAVLKRRAGLPPDFVIRAVMPHGPNIASKLWANELKHPLSTVLALSAQQAQLYQQQCAKTVHVIGSPLFLASELIGSELADLRRDAAGTIVFPTHSTHHVTVEFDCADLIDFLRTLPAEFQPIHVCLYWRDIQLGRHREFLQAGFDCTTAGHMFDPEFPFRLLRLLAAHRSAAVNKLGSSAYYAAAFGLPVLLHDQTASFSGREERFLGELSPEFDLPAARQFLELSRVPPAEAIRRQSQQQEIAWREMGREFAPAPAQLRHLLESLPAAPALRPPPAPVPEPAKSRQAKATRFTIEATTDSLVSQLRPIVAGHPRRVPGQVKLDDRPFAYVDLHSLYHQAQQIFGQRLYDFRPDTDRPLIIDGGAHIGLASLHFARLFPRATIHAFEADPQIAAVLASNLGAFALKQVHVHARALWTTNDGVPFAATADDSGHIRPSAPPSASPASARVPSVRLREFLAAQSAPVDLLKLDIEGAEFEVLRDCDGALNSVRNVLIEVHQFRDGDGRLGELLGVLERNGFDYALGDLHPATWIESPNRPPFAACKSKHYIVTVFAWQTASTSIPPASQTVTASLGPAPESGPVFALPPTSATSATVASDSIDAVLREAVTHLNSRRDEAALRCFDQAIRAGASESRLHYGRSVALARLGRRDEALAALTNLTEADPAHARAQALANELTAPTPP